MSTHYDTAVNGKRVMIHLQSNRMEWDANRLRPQKRMSSSGLLLPAGEGLVVLPPFFSFSLLGWIGRYVDWFSERFFVG